MRFILIEHSLEDEMGGTCSTCGKITKVWLENLKGRHIFEDLGLDGWNILKKSERNSL
jgi:hypothetical protein